jgi:hypothetical protein
MTKNKSYVVAFNRSISKEENDWNGGVWKNVAELKLDAIRPESIRPYPSVSAKVLYDAKYIYVFYKIRDYNLRCTYKKFLDPVHLDSCIEFFAMPEAAIGYCNFEFNCRGVLDGAYIEDWTRTPDGFVKAKRLNLKDKETIKIFTTAPEFKEEEISGEFLWYFQCKIPFKLFEKYIGRVVFPENEIWKANFYKCGDKTKTPHWCSWNKTRKLNFHDPECFGELIFAAKDIDYTT